MTNCTGAIPNSAGTSAVSADVTGDPLARCKASTKNVDCSAVPPEACFVGSDVDDGSTDYSCLAGDPPDLELVALFPNLTLCFGVGSHTVTLEVVNQDGLTSDCTAPVTVSNVANCGPTTPPISAPPTEAPVTPAPVATTSSPTSESDSFDAPALVPFAVPFAPNVAPAIAPFVNDLTPVIPPIFFDTSGCEQTCVFLFFFTGLRVHIDFFGLFCIDYCAGFLGTFKVDTGLLQCGRCPS